MCDWIWKRDPQEGRGSLARAHVLAKAKLSLRSLEDFVVPWGCPKNVYIFRTTGCVAEMTNTKERPANPNAGEPNLKASVLERMTKGGSSAVWTPNDFLDLASRSSVDKTLQRLVLAGDIRRIDRGLYDHPRLNRLTGKPTNPDYTAVIDAVARRDKARLLPDGITAANQLGLTNAVPAKITVHTDARLRPIQLERLTIEFKLTAPSRLYWAGRPAMQIVQSLHWFHDILPADSGAILRRIRNLLIDPVHGEAIRNDLQAGLDALPGWMRDLVADLLASTGTVQAHPSHQSAVVGLRRHGPRR